MCVSSISSGSTRKPRLQQRSVVIRFLWEGSQKARFSGWMRSMRAWSGGSTSSRPKTKHDWRGIGLADRHRRAPCSTSPSDPKVEADLFAGTVDAGAATGETRGT